MNNGILENVLDTLLPQQKKFGGEGAHFKVHNLLMIMSGITNEEQMEIIFDWATKKEVHTTTSGVTPVTYLFASKNFETTPQAYMKVLNANPYAMNCFCDIVVYAMLSKSAGFRNEEEIETNLLFWHRAANEETKIQDIMKSVYKTIITRMNENKGLTRMVRKFNMEMTLINENNA